MLSNSSGVLRSIPRSPAPSTMASPRGCSDIFSQDPASLRSVFSSISPNGITSVTFGFPSVTVPVLSSTTASTLCPISRASPLLIRMPCFALTPVPTMMAVGVASPSAQGHAMTSTATKMVSTKEISLPPTTSHRSAATTAMHMTVGTKYPATRSASLEMGAFFPWASSIIFTIFASVVSLPT